MADSLAGKVLSGLSVKHMFELIFGMSLMLSKMRAESRSWMSPCQRMGRRCRRRSEIASSCLDMRWLLPEDVLRRDEEARREEYVVVARLRHGVAKEGIVEALSEASWA